MIHPTARESKQVNRKCPIETRFYNFQPLWPTLSYQFLHPKISASYLFIILMTRIWLSAVIIVEWKPDNCTSSYTTWSAISATNSCASCYQYYSSNKRLKIPTFMYRHLQENLNSSGLQFTVAYWPAPAIGGAAQLSAWQTHLCPSQPHYGFHPAMFPATTQVRTA